jgi:hypothetical protein
MDWACSRCTFVNHGAMLLCEVCEAPTGALPEEPGQRMQALDQDQPVVAATAPVTPVATQVAPTTNIGADTVHRGARTRYASRDFRLSPV